MKKTFTEISSYLENISILLLGILFIAFPLFLLTITTDPYVLPKEILLGAVSLLTLIALGGKMISDAQVKLRRTPFDLPVILFVLVILVSAWLSINRYEALTAFVPLLLAAILYFIIVSFITSESSLFFMLLSVVAGAVILSLVSILTYFKIYILPLGFTHSQTFTPLGSSLDQAMYLFFILPIALYFAKNIFKAKSLKDIQMSSILFGITSIIIVMGLLITVYSLFTIQKTYVLPFETGFQTAFAAISQDPGRIAQGFFFGSGFGTYYTDFTRFKQVAFNSNPALWNLTFVRSSSFALELLATTGVLGIGAFIFLIATIFKKTVGGQLKNNPVFFSLMAIVLVCLILPFSYIEYALLFLLLGLFSAHQAVKHPKNFYEFELQFVALKKGFIAFSTEPEVQKHSLTRFLPSLFLAIFIAVAAFLAYNSWLYVWSDVLFAQSLTAASQNNGVETYSLESKAISTFPYNDAYHRIFSQTNLSLANSLILQQPKASSPSAQTQQTITNLIQQSITEARTATSVSPLNAADWQNLASIYRSLIGFGQNAENFATLANQQAIVLDPNNPQEYIDLGGIYFQLKQWGNAQREFQTAVNLKPDLANAYYNLGHVFQAKNDLTDALSQYEIVKSLVANNPAALKQINSEIAAINKQAGSQSASEQASPSVVKHTSAKQTPLKLSTPSAELPQKKNPVQLPAPTVSITPTITPSPTVTPSK